MAFRKSNEWLFWLRVLIWFLQLSMCKLWGNRWWNNYLFWGNVEAAQWDWNCVSGLLRMWVWSCVCPRYFLIGTSPYPELNVQIFVLSWSGVFVIKYLRYIVLSARFHTIIHHIMYFLLLYIVFSVIYINTNISSL